MSCIERCNSRVQDRESVCSLLTGTSTHRLMQKDVCLRIMPKVAARALSEATPRGVPITEVPYRTPYGMFLGPVHASDTCCWHEHKRLQP